MTFVAHYMRYGATYQHEADTLYEVVSFLMGGEDDGNLSSLKVTDDAGNVIFDKKTLSDMFIHDTWREDVSNQEGRPDDA